MAAMMIAALFRYPVKSLGGDAPPAATIEPRGIAGDRRWMVIDANARFVTRRERPAMALIDAVPTDAGLMLRHPTLGTCTARTPDDAAEAVEATVWRDRVRVRVGNRAADAFLSAALGRPVRLAWQSDEARRAIGSTDDQVSLADGFPLLVNGTASLDALNARLAVPVGMDRFRPNLVVAGSDAWAEDRWRRIRIGEVVLRIAAPCTRCVVVTQQPRTGERREGNEPLETLRAMGRFGPKGAMFGQNAIPQQPGTIRVGDPVEVLDEGDSNVG